MIGQFHYYYEKFRPERSEELAAAFDITSCGMSVVIYDIALERRYARAALACENITAQTVLRQMARLLSLAMQKFGIPARSIKRVGAAADTHITVMLETELTSSDLFLPPETEIYVLPYISAGLGGRFTAALLTVPHGDIICADVGASVCAAVRSDGKLKCVSFPLSGAFDCSSLTFGMPAENGAIISVYREESGELCYSVVGDGDAAGISPCGAVRAAVVMLEHGIVDDFGIMTDRDRFTVGEEIFITQEDVRAIQTDKARTAAALELAMNNGGAGLRAFISGEPFADGGMKSMLSLGAVPRELSGAAFCRNSAEQGVVRYVTNEAGRDVAHDIVMSAEDMSNELMPEFDDLYIKNLEFMVNL